MHENKIIYLLAMSVLKVGGKFVTPMLIGIPTDDAFVGVDGLLWLDLQHNIKSLKHFKCSQQFKALLRLVAGCCRITVDCSSAVKIEKFQLIATHCISHWSQQNRYSLNEP